MLSFGVSNLRRLKFVPPIELRPITILVGKNSSGKSSFLRAFPLLRQSLMTRTSSPILWYGDLVDFGSFDISVSDNSIEEPISFSFVVDKLKIEEQRGVYWRLGYLRAQPEERFISGVHFDVSIVRSGERTRISRILVRIDDPKSSYEIIVGSDSKVVSLKLDGDEVVDLFKPIKFQITTGSLFPDMSVVPDDTKKVSVRSQPSFFVSHSHEFTEPIKHLLRPHLRKARENTLDLLVNALLVLGTVDKNKILESLSRFGPKSAQKLIAEICGRDKFDLYPKLHDMLSLATLPMILSQIRSHLRAVITSTLYIGPARARSERYYRYQDLAVSEIDPDGKNFPMFLNSLAPYQITQLSEWIEGLFEYGLTISRESGGGHMSINLVAKGTKSNIVDTGYGVSQILPVLGQIWWARTRLRQPNQAPLALIAIEQPELHLHPAHQALLADALVGELSGKPSTGDGSDSRIHFLIETHSETLLNRLGELVATGKILNTDIQVVLFEAIDEERLTDVKTSYFGPSGELIDWPYGFFQPTVR
jgi:hypothetical protein